MIRGLTMTLPVGDSIVYQIELRPPGTLSAQEKWMLPALSSAIDGKWVSRPCVADTWIWWNLPCCLLKAREAFGRIAMPTARLPL